jgi:hypothetical protein
LWQPLTRAVLNALLCGFLTVFTDDLILMCVEHEPSHTDLVIE